ncbi:sensor histidine kinase [Parapedobacter koreensis]|uniref:Histidine kinase-, DNA gyrase B-, and HSP90-like ATPase n=1 Tax=Parapedobacter koreensis TaxID=332977 RepID=A0A1H7FXG5_9SPHI|nr:histidine kinase [Parapedobacter koreensis]SEK30763.1 Histidine kinase-, DNA gyrase B-, and HSP90-like ATPase [Parapedobacter koreensis]
MILKLKFLLLLGASTIFNHVAAQDGKSLFNLQKGDWFVMRADVDLTPEYNRRLHQVNKDTRQKSIYWLRFTLQQTATNGHQIYGIQLIRYRHEMAATQQTRPFPKSGYDSFYPLYEQGKTSLDTLPTYLLELTPDGTIQLQRDGAPHTTQLGQTGKITDFGTKVRIITETFRDDMLALLVNLMTIPQGKEAAKTFHLPDETEVTARIQDSRQQGAFLKEDIGFTEDIQCHLFRLIDSRVPSLIKTSSGLNLVMVAASFDIPGNATIKGNIKHHTVATPIATPYKFSGTEHRVLTPQTMGEGGSFEESVHLETATSLFFLYGDQALTIFLSPGDTLTLTTDARDMADTYAFAGNAAQNSELAQRIGELLMEQSGWGSGKLSTVMRQKDTDAFHAFIQEENRKAQQLFENYLDNASPDAINYYRREWAFALATSKLQFLSTVHYKSHQDAQVPFSDFPKDFFTDIDTMEASSGDANTIIRPDYHTWLVQYYQARIGVAPIWDDDFLRVFPFIIATSSGHTQYKTLHTFLKRAISGSDWHTNQRIKPYYEDFMKNCQDSAMTNNLKREWAWNEQWEPGISASLLALPLLDGSSVELSRYKGKPLCLIVSEFFVPTELAAYAAFIKDKTNSDVQFVIAQIRQQPDVPSVLHDSLFQGIPNVELLELAHHPKDIGPIGTSGYSSKWFVLDPWLRVVAGNLQPTYRRTNDVVPTMQTISYPGTNSYPVKLEELLDKARKAHRFTKAQTAEFRKIAGWTFVSILLTTLVIGVTNRRRTQALKKREAMKHRIQQLEIKALRSQMNPHFIFNALNSIQSLITENRFRDANIYLAEFASLLRGVLNNSEKPGVSLSDELEAVEHYCRLEQLRFDFTYRIHVPDDVSPELIEIPSMIIQPLVENSIVHGFAQKRRKACLTIAIEHTNCGLTVTVADNGTGLPVEGQVYRQGNGMGLKLVEERVRNFNNTEKNTNLTLQNRIENGKIGGATATITLMMD